MLKQIQLIARQTGEAAAPVRFLFGTVTALDPLTVLVDSRYALTDTGDAASPLIPLQELWGHRHRLPAHGTSAAANHSHAVPELDTDTAEALAVGDRVALLQNRGGQQYLILGRV